MMTVEPILPLGVSLPLRRNWPPTTCSGPVNVALELMLMFRAPAPSLMSVPVPLMRPE